MNNSFSKGFSQKQRKNYDTLHVEILLQTPSFTIEKKLNDMIEYNYKDALEVFLTKHKDSPVLKKALELKGENSPLYKALQKASAIHNEDLPKLLLKLNNIAFDYNFCSNYLLEEKNKPSSAWSYFITPSHSFSPELSASIENANAHSNNGNSIKANNRP